MITAHTDGRTDTQWDAGNDNTRRPNLASGKNVNFDFTWDSKLAITVSLDVLAPVPPFTNMA